MEAYCMKCKAKREMRNEKEEVTDKGLKMIRGQCTTCGTNVCKFLGKIKG